MNVTAFVALALGASVSWPLVGETPIAALAPVPTRHVIVCETSDRVETAPMFAVTCAPGGITMVDVCTKPIAAVDSTPYDGGMSLAAIPQVALGLPPRVK